MREIKMVLINALFGVRRFMEPIATSYLAAILRQEDIPGLSVDIFESSIDGDTIESTIEKISKKDYNYIGLSFTIDDIELCKEFVDAYRNKGGTATILVGGHGPSLVPEDFLLNGIEAVFIGDGDFSLPDYLREVSNDGNISNVKGIAFRDANNKIIITKPSRRPSDLDNLPFMARDVLEELIKKHPGSISARLISSRGCYMFCEYCSIKTYAKLQEGPSYRERSIDNLISEIKILNEKYNVRQFLFEDDNFLPKNEERAKKKVDYFCDSLKKLCIPDLKLHMQFRPDSVNSYVIERLKNVGLVDLFIGIENINQKDMEFFGRRSDVRQYFNILEELNRLGFSCDINAEKRLRIGYIMFNPESTRETIGNSIEFLDKYHVSPKKLTNILRPYKRTDIREKFIKKGYLGPNEEVLFKDKEIGIIANAIVSTVSMILDFRNQVRLPVKLNRELELGFNLTDTLAFLDDIRRECDVKCYAAAREILNANVSEIQSIKLKYQMIVEKYQRIILEDDKLNQIKHDMKIDSLETGIYR